MEKRKPIRNGLFMLLGIWSAAITQPGFTQQGSLTRQELIEQRLIVSYISVGGGFNLPSGHGDFGDLLFEADINQHLHFSPEFFKSKLFIKINPRVRLRMSNTTSSPVRTPSFMPNLTVFFNYGGSKPLRNDEGFTYYSAMFSHHSNGQADPFYKTDGLINLNSGNFSTDFIELAINRIWGERRIGQAWTRLALTWHPEITRSEELDRQYERTKITLESSTIRGIASLLGFNFELNGYLSLVVDGVDYIFIPSTGIQDARAQKAGLSDRIYWGLGLNFGKKKAGDFRWFIKFDHGYDYYNIHFWRKLRRVQFGIAGDPF